MYLHVTRSVYFLTQRKLLYACLLYRTLPIRMRMKNWFIRRSREIQGLEFERMRSCAVNAVILTQSINER